MSNLVACLLLQSVIKNMTAHENVADAHISAGPASPHDSRVDGNHAEDDSF